MSLMLMPDSILENWGTDMRDAVMERKPYCLLRLEEKHDLITRLLNMTLDGIVSSANPQYLKLDPMNGEERRDKGGGHLKIILESLGRNPNEYDETLRALGFDMEMVEFYYQERRKSNSFYRTGLVYES